MKTEGVSRRLGPFETGTEYAYIFILKPRREIEMKKSKKIFEEILISHHSYSISILKVFDLQIITLLKRMRSHREEENLYNSSIKVLYVACITISHSNSKKQSQKKKKKQSHRKIGTLFQQFHMRYIY